MNVLAVGAHFDDIEFGCSGTLMKHVRNGDKVTVLVITNSSYKDPDGVEIRSADVACSEGKKAADIIGAEMICLGYDTFMVPYDEGLTKELSRYVSQLNIDTIYCHWVKDIHRDHHYTAKSTLMAGRHVPRFMMYRSNYYDAEEQFKGVFYSDISDVMDRKIEVMKAHASELQRVENKWLDFFVKQNANHGMIIGVDYAECFEVIRYLW